MNIIITGASRGIGYETAKLLSAEHNVIAIARSSDKLEQLKKEGNSKNIFPIAFDFEKGNIKQNLIPEIISSLSQGRGTEGEVAIDVLINNAAALIKKPFEEITQADFEKVYRVNLFSIAELTQAIFPLMNHAGRDFKSRPTSHVLNIASMGGVQGSVKFPGLSAYSSSKGALITLTECLAEEFKDKQIAFNAIAFGAVQTEMLAEAFPGFKAPITAKEAAEFVAQFATTGQKYFNGKILQMALSTP
ncbi:MAG: SDR family oxidoreductase [Bacteroidetes bacterium]|nr:SDR family oxidoreductase [Bacteroidota bacterium]